MIIERIKLKNWLAFKGDHELELPIGPIAVVARYEENSARSNWAGKTAFLESIEWALFGVHRKRYEDDVIFEGADEVEVTLTFDNGFTVNRKRKRGKPSRLIVGVPVFSQTEEGTHIQYHEKDSAESMIKKTLGFDAEDFRATVCFSQGDTEAIVDRTSGERRKIIGQWLELDVWSRIQGRARAHLKKLLGNHEFMKSELAGLNDRITKLRELELPKRRAEEIAERDKAAKLLKELDEELEVVAGHHELKQTFDLYQTIVAEARTLKEELTGAKVEGLEEARAALERARTQRALDHSACQQAKDLAEGYFNGHCPVMRSECPVKDRVVIERKLAAERYEQAKKIYEASKAADETKQAEVSELEKEDFALMKKRERFNAVVGHAKLLKPKADRWQQTAEHSAEHIVKLRAQRDSTREILSRKEAAILQCDRDIELLQESEDDRKKFEEGIVEREKDIKIANLVVKASGSTGIPSYIAESVISKLEERSNALLVDSGLSIAFAMDRETRDVSPSCFECGYLYKGKKDKECPACAAPRGMKRADELEILVEDGSGVLEDVKMKSGGARALIASAIRLAAGLMLKELRSSRCAFAEIDEPFGALDAENRRGLTNVFSGMLNAVGLEQAFIVSHDTELLDSLPGRVLITRCDGFSKINLIT